PRLTSRSSTIVDRSMVWRRSWEPLPTPRELWYREQPLRSAKIPLEEPAPPEQTPLGNSGCLPCLPVLTRLKYPALGSRSLSKNSLFNRATAPCSPQRCLLAHPRRWLRSPRKTWSLRRLFLSVLAFRAASLAV